MQDTLIAVVDGLKGLPDAITAVFPKIVVQACIVHLTRPRYRSPPGKIARTWPARSGLSTAPPTKKAACKALRAFDDSEWGRKYAPIAQNWHRAWEHVVPFFTFPEAVRRIIYTTNAIEALNSMLRRAVRTRGNFPNNNAAMKLLYLVLSNAGGAWKRPPREWVEAKNRFAILFEERFQRVQ